MAAKNLAPRARIPMAVAATELAQLCDAIDNGAEPSAALVAMFNERRLELAESVDRRIMFLTLVEGQIEQARAMRAGWDTQVQRLKALHDTMRAKTREIIEAAPDLPYQGTLGKLAIQKNGGLAPVATEWGDKALTAAEIEMFGIDERYVQTETTYKLLTDVVRGDLEAGEDLGWAHLAPRGMHLKVKLEPGVKP